MASVKDFLDYFTLSRFGVEGLHLLFEEGLIIPCKGQRLSRRKWGLSSGYYAVKIGNRKSNIILHFNMGESCIVYVYNSADLQSIYRLIREKSKEVESNFEVREIIRPILPQEMYDRIEENIFNFYKAMRELQTSKGFGNVGIIFEGPPGVGKTETLRWIREYVCCKFNRGVHQFSWEDLIQMIQKGQPFNGDGLVLMDDVDVNILRDRRITNNPATSQLLTCMDGMHKREGRVMIVSTNEKIDNIDPALLRPGRFDHIWTFEYPTIDLIQQFLDERGVDLNKSMFDGWSFARIDMFLSKWRVANHMYGTSIDAYYEKFIYEMGEADPIVTECTAETEFN